MIVRKLCNIAISPVPLSIATADGSKRGNKKSNLLPIIKDKIINENIITIPDTNKVSAYILDFMLFKNNYRHSIKIEDLEWHVIKEIPTGYNRVDIVADNYKPVSIKMQVRDG